MLSPTSRFSQGFPPHTAQLTLYMRVITPRRLSDSEKMIASLCKAAVLRIRPSGQVKAVSALGRRLTYRMRRIIVAWLLSNVWGSMHRRCIHHSGRTIPRPPKSLRNRSLHMAYARLRLIWPSSSTVICSCAIILPSALWATASEILLCHSHKSWKKIQLHLWSPVLQTNGVLIISMLPLFPPIWLS